MEPWVKNYRGSNYASEAAEGFVTAVNILAVEYLVKQNNFDEYSRWINVLYTFAEEDLEDLQLYLSINKHTSSLGAMITQGDYDHQREILMDFLKEKENGCC